MWLKVCLIFNFISITLSYDDEINWLVPFKKIVLPQKFKTSVYGISLPPMKRFFEIAERNLQSLNISIDTGESFKEKNNASLYPIFELGLRLKALIASINNLIKEFRKILQIPMIFGSSNNLEKTTISISADSLLPDFDFVEYSLYIAHINKAKDLMPSEGQTVPDFRKGAEFHKLETSAALLTIFLQNYRDRLLTYYRTMRYLAGNIHVIPSDEIFVSEFIESAVGGQFEILSFMYFEATITKVYVILELAVIENKSEYQKYMGIEYFGHRISNDLYGQTGTKSLNELVCFSQTLCIPIISKCSKSLLDDNFTAIISHCNFKKSKNEYDIIPNIGIILNYEPTSKSLIQYLATNKIEIPSYPCLMTLQGCITFDVEGITFCFSSPFSLITSGLDLELLRKTFHPTWYEDLDSNLNNIPTVLTALIFMFISFIIFCFGKLSYKWSAKLSHQYKQARTPVQRNRVRPIPQKMRPILQEMRELNKKI